MPSLELRSAGTRTSFERVVRPNVVLESHLRDRTPAPAEVPEQEAEIRWGKASTFQWSTTNAPPTQGGGVVVSSGGDDSDTDPGPAKVVFEEIGQLTKQKAVRVFNKDDHDQYVDVANPIDITWTTPTNLLSALIAQRDGSVTDLFFEFILHPDDRPAVSVDG